MMLDVVAILLYCIMAEVLILSSDNERAAFLPCGVADWLLLYVCDGGTLLPTLRLLG